MYAIRPTIHRRGHTFIELMTAMASSAMLLGGLAAVLMISRQIAYTPTASTSRLAAAKTINRLADELRCAQWITEQSAETIEFVVADRDGDGTGERIAYSWTGNELERTVNGGAPAVVATNVYDFHLDYVLAKTTDRLFPVSDGAETLLASNTATQGSAVRPINSQSHVSQPINPAAFTTPAGAISWNATRVDFYGRRNGTNNYNLQVQIRSGGVPNNSPTSEVLGSASIVDTSLTAGLGWNSATFAGQIRSLSLSQRYNVVWASPDAGTSLQLNYVDTGSSGPVLESTGSNAGAAWQHFPARYVFYRLYGTFAIADTPIDVDRWRVSTVNLTLRMDDATHARIEAAIPLTNEPELVSAVWRCDFEPAAPNPTAIDIDANSAADWALGSGSFAVNTVSDGKWTVNGSLQTRPLNNFANVTAIDARCRNGAVLRINSDRQGGTHGPLIVRLTTVGSQQTLTLVGETAAGVEKTLATVARLPADWIRFRLLIVPSNNVVRLQIGDQTIGTYTYPTYNTATTDRFLSVSGNGSQFDYVDVRVSDGATVTPVN